MRIKLREGYKNYPSPENLQHRYLIALTSLIQEAEELKSYLKQTEPEDYIGRHIERSLRNMFGQLHDLNQCNKKIGLSRIETATSVEPSLKEKVMRLMQLEDTHTADRIGLRDFFKESGLQKYDNFTDIMKAVQSSDDLTSQIHSWYSKIYRQVVKDGEDNYAASILGINIGNI